MNNFNRKGLCLELLRADTEREIIDLLRARDLWDRPEYWRDYGDNENNFSQIGNQQGRSDAAFVEKIVNAVDAILTGECLAQGIDPESKSAPQSIAEATARFFETGFVNPDSPGQISGWPDKKRREVAQRITIAATGAPPRRGKPCLTIADVGEGQTPNLLPDTLLSLNKSNKLRIPFVQGKFNMGGTGALKFCGERNLQLIISKRNPKITDAADPSASEWGFTVVRRDDPRLGRRSSTYTYLAPEPDRESANGMGVLRFDSGRLPIFPKGNEPYCREAAWGTVIKLYEYEATNYSNTHILRDGLLNRLDILLPEVALPVRLHECRKSYGGHEGSFANNLTGIGVRLEDDKKDNLEFAPIACPFTVRGEAMRAKIYAFKKGRASAYTRSEGVIFTVNGQTHGHLTRDFFKRRNVGLSYLADSLLVSIDCSFVSGRSREDLFMNSRDRLSHHPLRTEIERVLEAILRNEPRLAELKARRREDEIQSKLDDSKPLEEVLAEVLKRSPQFSSLLLGGQRLSNPFKSKKVKTQPEKFNGKRFPSYFKFHRKQPGEYLERRCAVNQRARIRFETDAEDEYLSRKHQPGQFTLYMVVGGVRKNVSDLTGPTMNSGSASVSIQLPPNCDQGDELHYVAVINDISRVEPIENELKIVVDPAALKRKSTKGPVPTPRNPEGEGDETEAPGGVSLPRVTLVREEEWDEKDPPFDKFTAVRVIDTGIDSEKPGDEGSATVYDFFVNADNCYLKMEQKNANIDAELLQARFVYGMVILALSLLSDDTRGAKPTNGSEGESDDVGIEEKVEQFTRAAGAVLLPIIAELGALDEVGAVGFEDSGEAT